MDITRRYYELLHQENQALLEADPDRFELGETTFEADSGTAPWEFGLAIIKRGGIVQNYDEAARVLTWVAPKEDR